MKVVLAGNPNSGKTTLFNGLTGRKEKVGNYAGVTVTTKKENLKEQYDTKGVEVEIIDLPGAYSMNPYTSEEVVTKDYIMKENPDLIVNIVDATNLSRALFLTTQLLELEIPVVIALNKTDLLKKKGLSINKSELSKYLRCPVVEIIATKSKDNGLDKLILECINRFKFKQKQIAPTIEGITNSKISSNFKSDDKKRYLFVKEIVIIVERKKFIQTSKNIQNKIDLIVTNRWLGIIIFAFIMYLIFSISQSLLGPFIADKLVQILESFQNLIANLFSNANPFIKTLLVDGIIGGVIAVIGFLPLIMVLFFLMALLEDCGYMARVAVVMDRFFKRIGLSGKSIIPMIIATGCGIPGVMSCRTIKNERQRKTTAMLTPFMPCGAKLPIIALFSGVFFSGSSLVVTSMYFSAIFIIIISALIIRTITGDTSQSYFILEMPEYRVPSIKYATFSMLNRAKGFIVKATTIILVCNTVIQIMQSFTWSLTLASSPSESILASIATPFAILFIPLGFGAWQFAAASITGFIAKENVVGTLAVVFGISNFIDVDTFELVAGSAQNVESAFALTSVAALSFLIFNLFTPPCFACIAAVRAEMNSAKWTIGAIGFQFSVGYILAFIVYQVGSILLLQEIGEGFVFGLIIVLIMSGVIGFFMYKGTKERKLNMEV